MLASDKVPGASAGSKPACAFLALVLLALAFPSFPQAPVDERTIDAPADEFSAGRVLKWLGARGSLEPRPGGTAPHAEFREALVESLEELGLEVEVQEALARGPSGRVALVRNVIARQFADAEGTSILLAAHYDTVGCSPGAADDGAGCASLIEIARALKTGSEHGRALSRPVVYLFSDAEEAGLIGAEAFASQHELAKNLGCVINLEARGNFGPSVMFQARGGPEAIAALARSAPLARASSLADFVYKLMPNDTDYSVFSSRGIHGFNFAFLGGLEVYHTPRDDLEGLDASSVQHQGEQALALTRELANERIEGWNDGRVVFTDVLGVGIVSWSPWIGIVLAAAATWFVQRRSRRDEGSAWGAIAHFGPGVSAAFAVALGAVWAEFAALGAYLGSPDAGARHPHVAELALTLTCGGAYLVVAALVTRRYSFREAWLALGSSLALLALVTSVALSEVSYLVLAPAILWCALETAIAPGRAGSTLRLWTSLVLFAALALLLWVPIRAQFWLALSFRKPVALAVPTAATLALLWPSLTLLPARPLARTGIALLVAGALLLAGVVFKVPGGTEGREWLNLRHVYDTELDLARFEASTFGARLPREIAAAAEWSRATTPPFPWMTLDPSMHVAPAPRIDAPPPKLEVLETKTLEGGRRVRCRLTSPRGAPRLHLHLPEEVSIETIEWRGQRIEGGFEGVRTQLLFAFEQDGVEFVLRDRAASPSSVHLIDQDWAWTSEHSALIEARDAYTHLPRSDGDIVFIGARHKLE
jgi:hypothetical protein